MDFKEVRDACASNKYIDAKLEQNILELLEIFTSTFRGVDLSGLINNLRTLTVEKTSTFVNPNAIDYNPKLNKLTINPKVLENTVDVKNLFMNILIRLIASKNGITGFDTDGSFKALNLGYIASTANMLVGNENEYDKYQDEILAVNMFSEIVGTDTLFNAFFTNNPGLIYNQAEVKGE